MTTLNSRAPFLAWCIAYCWQCPNAVLLCFAQNQKQNSQRIQKNVPFLIAQKPKQSLQRIPKIPKQNDEDVNACGVTISELFETCFWFNDDYIIPEAKVKRFKSAVSDRSHLYSVLFLLRANTDVRFRRLQWSQRRKKNTSRFMITEWILEKLFFP